VAARRPLKGERRIPARGSSRGKREGTHLLRRKMHLSFVEKGEKSSGERREHRFMTSYLTLGGAAGK